MPVAAPVKAKAVASVLIAAVAKAVPVASLSASKNEQSLSASKNVQKIKSATPAKVAAATAGPGEMLTCDNAMCGHAQFEFSAVEMVTYKSKGWGKPKRCQSCRVSKRDGAVLYVPGSGDAVPTVAVALPATMVVACAKKEPKTKRDHTAVEPDAGVTAVRIHGVLSSFWCEQYSDIRTRFS